MASQRFAAAASATSSASEARFSSLSIEPGNNGCPASAVLTLRKPEPVAFPAVSMDGEHTGPNGETVTRTSNVTELRFTIDELAELLTDPNLAPADQALVRGAVTALNSLAQPAGPAPVPAVR